MAAASSEGPLPPRHDKQAMSPLSAGSSKQTSKRRANDLLRNYYGLGESSSLATSPSTASSSTYRLDPDGSNFDSQAAFTSLLQEKNLSQLLRTESRLLTEIRELDGERQSLVYNHHHELVSASETIGKMKSQAETLSPSLISLQSSLRDISSGLQIVQMSPDVSPFNSPAAQSIGRKESSNPQLTSAEIQKMIAPAVELPSRLKDIILLDAKGKGLEKARGMWGTMEAVLANWDEAGIPGAKDIMNECRHVLREAQLQAK